MKPGEVPQIRALQWVSGTCAQCGRGLHVSVEDLLEVGVGDPATRPSQVASSSRCVMSNSSGPGASVLGRVGVAQRMAGHSSAKTTGLYDRRNDFVGLDEVERIGI